VSRLEDHLAECAACRRKIEEFRTVIECAERRERFEPSARVVDAVHQAAAAAIGRDAQRPAPFFRHRFWRLQGRPGAVLCTVVLLVAAVLATGVVLRRSVEPTLNGIKVAANGYAEPRDNPVLYPKTSGSTYPMSELEMLNMRFAGIEADTVSMHYDLAFERTSPFDRRMHSVEDAIYLLSAGLELE
jgi:hypothetical protein